MGLRQRSRTCRIGLASCTSDSSFTFRVSNTRFPEENVYGIAHFIRIFDTDFSSDETDCYQEIFEAGYFDLDPLATSSNDYDKIVMDEPTGLRGDFAHKVLGREMVHAQSNRVRRGPSIARNIAFPCPTSRTILRNQNNTIGDCLSCTLRHSTSQQTSHDVWNRIWNCSRIECYTSVLFGSQCM